MNPLVRHVGAGLRNRGQLVHRGIASAVQVSVAAGVAWWLAAALLPWEEPLYAPIAAIVAIGAGQNRLVGTPVRLLAGMLAAVGVAGLAVAVLGTGVWQLAVITLLATLTGRFLFDDSLARTYSAFHGAVIAVLGSERVIPEQLIEAAIGSIVGLVVVHLVFPPRVKDAAMDTVLTAAPLAHNALRRAALALEMGERLHSRRAIAAAEQLDATVAPDDGRQKFVRQIATLSPLRWPDRPTVDQALTADRELTELLLDVSSFVRLADHLVGREPTKRPHIAAAVDAFDAVLADALRAPPLPVEVVDRTRAALGRLRTELETAHTQTPLEQMVCEHLLQLAGTVVDVTDGLAEEQPVATRDG